MEKEKSSLELHLSGKESQEQAYIVQIKNLKTEIRDQRDSSSRGTVEAITIIGVGLVVELDLLMGCIGSGSFESESKLLIRPVVSLRFVPCLDAYV